jgi:hypothetical protein
MADGEPGVLEHSESGAVLRCSVSAKPGDPKAARDLRQLIEYLASVTVASEFGLNKEVDNFEGVAAGGV